MNLLALPVGENDNQNVDIKENDNNIAVIDNDKNDFLIKFYSELDFLKKEYNIQQKTYKDLLNYVAQPTTSPTIKQLKKQNKLEQLKEQDEQLVKENKKIEQPKEQPKETIRTEQPKQDNKISLTDEELKYLAYLIVELLDFGFLKLDKPLNKKLSPTSQKQKDRLIFAWQRWLITLNIRFSPLITVIGLTLITYGIKVVFAPKLIPKEQKKEQKTVQNIKQRLEQKKEQPKQPEKQTIKETAKVININTPKPEKINNNNLKEVQKQEAKGIVNLLINK